MKLHDNVGSDKNNKNTTHDSYGRCLTCCLFMIVPENKFSHNLKVHHGFILKRSYHGGKNIALRAEKQI